MSYLLSLAGSTENMGAHVFTVNGDHIISRQFGGIHLREMSTDILSSYLLESSIKLCDELTISLPDFQSQCKEVSFAVSGLDHRFDPAFVLGLFRCIGYNHITDDTFHISGVAEAVYRAVLTDTPGILIRSGAGCSVFSVGKNERKILATAYSTPFGDKGTASFLGKEVLSTIANSMNGIATQDEEQIAHAALKQRELDTPIEFYEDLQRRRILKGHFATLTSITTLSNVLFQLSRNGNRRASEILDATAEHLYLLARHQIEELDLDDSEFPVLFQGTLFQNHPGLAKRVYVKLREEFPNAVSENVQDYRMSAVVGASMILLAKREGSFGNESVTKLRVAINRLSKSDHPELFWKVFPIFA